MTHSIVTIELRLSDSRSTCLWILESITVLRQTRAGIQNYQIFPLLQDDKKKIKEEIMHFLPETSHDQLTEDDLDVDVSMQKR